MDVTPIKRVSASEQIFEQLKEKIFNGELQTGEKLPSENELCKLYNVSRTTIRQALANLSSLELIETRFGEGSFVKEVHFGNIVSSLLKHVPAGKNSILEVIEFRQLMEPPIAKLACQKATVSDIEVLQSIYNKMQEHQDDLYLFSQADQEFHLTIAKICQNTYILKIYSVISDVLSNAFEDIIAERGNQAGLKYHNLLLEAFISKDAGAAQKLMQEHMDDLKKDYSKKLG